MVVALTREGNMNIFIWRGYGDEYVPRGLADDGGNGPKHRNVGLIIGW